MKILQIMSGRGLGGAETYSTDLMLSLHKAGIDQCVVMHPKAPRFREVQEAGLRMASWVLSVPIRPLQRLCMRILIAKEKPSVIHCWMRRPASLIPKTKIPTIGWFGGYYDPKNFKKCKFFVGVTRDIVTHMIKKKIPAEHAFYIPTFPDIQPLPAIDRLSLATPADAKVLLALSRLHPKKGLDILLEALKELPDCYVWLAGAGPLKRQLEMQAKTLGVIDRVRFLGWRTDRAALLKSCDVCVLPSRYEPFGTVILEAWAAKVPLVAARSAGPSAHVEDGVNGLLVPIDSVSELAEAIKHCLGDGLLRARMIANGYEKYVKNFTCEAVTQQWITFYKQLLV